MTAHVEIVTFDPRRMTRAEQAHAFIARYARETGHAPGPWMVALYLDMPPKRAASLLRAMAAENHGQSSPRQ